MDKLAALCTEVGVDGPLAGTDESVAASTLPDAGPSTSSGGIAKIRYTHDAMIDLIIAQPSISQNQLALHFGYTASWISTIMCSDAFQARLAERREQLIDPELRQSIEVQFRGLVARSLEILQEKLSKPAANVPDQLALRTLEIASRAAGYGAEDRNKPKPADVHVHLNVLGDRLVGLLQQKRAEAGGITIEGELVGQEGG